MATADQLKALLQSHGSGDDDRFYAVALQVAAAEAKRGHMEVANDLKRLVDAAKGRRTPSISTSSIFPVARPTGEVADLLDQVETSWRVKDVVMADPLRQRVFRIMEEQQSFSRLKEHGLRPRQRLLFTGPPGCGKTMTASALAGDLSLPVFVVRLDSLITRYLGESLTKLRLIFETVERTRAVYLFDEFDSIGYTRDFVGDVGEMRRLLNSFLGFIEKLSGNSIVIAATNQGGRLDKALYRRFDDLIEFCLPDEEQTWALIKSRLSAVNTAKLNRARFVQSAHGLSHAEITRACDEAIKAMVLQGNDIVTAPMLLSALAERRAFLKP